MRQGIAYGRSIVLLAALAGIVGCADEAVYISEFADLPIGHAECPFGGVEIRSGFDEDENDDLSDGEVDRTTSVCNGVPGVGDDTLVRVDEIPAGGRCLTGGTVIFSGVDTNSNGVLDDGEVTDTSFVCNGEAFFDEFLACEGDAARDGTFIINTEADIAALAGVECIRGSLIVDTYLGTSLAGLESLKAVTEDVLVINNPNLNSLAGLSGLVIVGRNFVLQTNPAVPTLEGLEAFDQVLGTLTVTGMSGLTNLAGLENLDEVQGSIRVISNPNMTSLSGLENLRTANWLEIENNDMVASLEPLNGVQTLRGQLRIDGNDALTLIELTGLQRVSVAIEVAKQINAPLARFPALDLSGQIRFVDNDTLARVEFPALVAVSGGISFARNLALDTIEFPRLIYVSGAIFIQSNPVLQTTAMPELVTTGGNFLFRDNAEMTDFAGFGSLRTVGGDFDVQDMGVLPDFAGLTALTTINGNFVIHDNPNLVSFNGLDALTRIRANVDIKRNPRLSDAVIAAFLARVAVGGTTDVEDNGGST